MALPAMIHRAYHRDSCTSASETGHSLQPRQQQSAGWRPSRVRALMDMDQLLFCTRSPRHVPKGHVVLADPPSKRPATRLPKIIQLAHSNTPMQSHDRRCPPIWQHADRHARIRTIHRIRHLTRAEPSKPEGLVATCQYSKEAER